tara:strand:- start:280 stop:453 length:174 start_codon:yes stop_codon:yes gene_type:complete
VTDSKKPGDRPGALAVKADLGQRHIRFEFTHPAQYADSGGWWGRGMERACDLRVSPG